MIKNNFIITEEEKKHILDLVRLPNHKNPYSLNEQATAEQPKRLKYTWNEKPAAGSNVVGPGRPAATGGSAGQSSGGGQVQNSALAGFVNAMGLNVTDPKTIDRTQIQSIAYQIADRINNGYRSIVFGYFPTLIDTLKTSDSTNSGFYQGLLDKVNSVSETAKSSFSKNLPSGSNHDPMTEPLDSEKGYYTRKSLNDNYGIKNFKDSIYGWAPKQFDVTQQVESLDCDKCNRSTQNYVNLILTNRIASLSQSDLERAKTELKACWESFEVTGEKNIFGRYKIEQSCKNNGESRKIYRQFVKPLIEGGEIRGVKIDEKYKLNIVAR